MNLTVVQTRALARLVFRYWQRAGLPNRLRKDHGRRASGGVLRLAALLVMTNWGYSTGTLSAGVGHAHRAAAIAWLLVGIGGFAWTWGMLGRVPGLRGVQSPLQSPLLDALPIREASRVVIGLFERLLAYSIGVSSLWSAAGSWRGAVLGITLTTAGLLVGEATMRFVRVLLPPPLVARVGVGLIVLQIPAMIAFASAPTLAHWRYSALAVRPLIPIALATEEGDGFVLALGAAFGLVALAAGAIRLAERLGYDRVDVVPQKRLVNAHARDLDVARIETVLVGREPGGRWGLRLMAIYVGVLAMLALMFAWTLPSNKPIDGETRDLLGRFLRGIAALAAFMGFSIVTGRATRMVQRDVAARPMLAALPIAPADLVRGKSRTLVYSALFVASPYLLVLGMPLRTHVHLEAAWRGIAVLAAVALAAIAIVCVSFLTEGVGSIRVFGGSVTIETTLVIVPLLAVATAPYVWNAIVSLGALALLAFEARRSALRSVRWIDDADDFERETPVWRALLVFATFQASQTLGQRALAFAPVAEQVRVAGAYVVAALVLVVLTTYGRRDRPNVRVMPERAAWLVSGLALGGATGLAGFGWVRLLHAVGVELPGDTNPTTAGALAIALVAIVVAPPVEELFFRGWLQSAMRGDLAPTRAWLAPLLGAFAFAAVHPALSFPPVLLLGLAAGLLYARTGSIAPGIVAHVAHNSLVLVLS
jgi:hypothetical protein